jgi:hypothetical protein
MQHIFKNRLKQNQPKNIAEQASEKIFSLLDIKNNFFNGMNLFGVFNNSRIFSCKNPELRYVIELKLSNYLVSCKTQVLISLNQFYEAINCR